jgi:hypothetical protein
MADTLWESLCKNAAYKLIAVFPEIVRKGSGPLGIPPLVNQPLPEVQDFDLGRKVVRCKDDDEVGTNLLSITQSLLNGLDTVGRFERARFTRPNTQIVIPLVFEEVKLDGKWRIRQQCGKVFTVRTGGYACKFQRLQVDVTLTIDEATARLTGATATLTDRTGTWKGQPEVAVQFDNASPGEQTALRPLFTSVLKGELPIGGVNFKDAVRDFIQGEEIARRMRTLVQAFLDKVLGSEAGNIVQKLERRFNQAWASAFDPNSPFYLPKHLPEPLSMPGNLVRLELPVALPSIPYVGWTSVGNAYFVVKDGQASGLRSVKPAGSLELLDGGARARVGLGFAALTAKGAWSLEQKIRKGVCAFRSFLAAIGQEDRAENLDPFRKAEKDLRERGGALGSWYVDRYYAHGAALQALLDNEQFKKALARFQGVKIWETMMTIINNASWTEPPKFPTELQDDALALVIEALTLTDGTPLGKTLVQLTEGRYVMAYMGKSYDEVLRTIAAQKPPAQAAAEEEEPAAEPAPAAAEEETWAIPGTWTVSMGLSVTPVVTIQTGDDGAAPKLAVTSKTASLHGFTFDYSSTHPIAWLAIFFQKWLLPGIKDLLSPFIQEKIRDKIGDQVVIPESLGKAIEELWKIQIPVS